MEKKLGEGSRLNTGKVRHDLLPINAVEQMARVMTKGSEKYAERNWENGMDWSKCLASLKRHVAAFERGEDYDPETGLLHMAHAMTNAAFITEYYKIFPQGDDRQHTYLNTPKIGLDIDDVLADFVGHYANTFGLVLPTAWKWDRQISDRLQELKDNKEFWLSMPVKTPASDISFEPHCYVTARIAKTEWTEEWLDMNGFPAAKVYSIYPSKDKVGVIKESGTQIFVDDSFDNFVELNNAGICCFLFDALHNRRYKVGYKRITSLLELTGEKPAPKNLEEEIRKYLSVNV